MKKIYFAGKFNKLKQRGMPLSKALCNDYRAKLLHGSELLTYYQKYLVVDNKFEYAGPFYCEQASGGNFTSTDCTAVLNAEYNFILSSDVFVVVLGESFSVGSVVELGWALNADKQIILLYQEEDSAYTIKSEYWFAIADAVKRSQKLTVRKYADYSEITSLINQTLEEIL